MLLLKTPRKCVSVIIITQYYDDATLLVDSNRVWELANEVCEHECLKNLDFKIHPSWRVYTPEFYKLPWTTVYLQNILQFEISFFKSYITLKTSEWSGRPGNWSGKARKSPERPGKARKCPEALPERVRKSFGIINHF